MLAERGTLLKNTTSNKIAIAGLDLDASCETAAGWGSVSSQKTALRCNAEFKPMIDGRELANLGVDCFLVMPCLLYIQARLPT